MSIPTPEALAAARVAITDAWPLFKAMYAACAESDQLSEAASTAIDAYTDHYARALDAFAEQARREERERCAEVAEGFLKGAGFAAVTGEIRQGMLRRIAHAIRARSTTKGEG